MNGLMETELMRSMTDQQRLFFIGQMSANRKDGTTAVLLALFLGGLGAHRFYMGQVGLGIAYVLFCWTLIPTFVAWIECFMMSSRVNAYNDNLALRIAAQVKAT